MFFSAVNKYYASHYIHTYTWRDTYVYVCIHLPKQHIGLHKYVSFVSMLKYKSLLRRIKLKRQRIIDIFWGVQMLTATVETSGKTSNWINLTIELLQQKTYLPCWIRY